MILSPHEQQLLKRQAAEAAVTYIQSQSVIGLGTGSTVQFALEALAKRLHEGTLYAVLGVPTSEATATAARALGIPLTTLDDSPQLALTIDGADEVDPDLNLIKGLGGALLREKIVAAASAQFLVIVDQSKQVQQLGVRSPLPVEVLPFGWRTHLAPLAQLGCEPRLRRRSDDTPYVSDNGNFILDCHFPDGIHDAVALAATLDARVGVVEHGLFLGMATHVLTATLNGTQVQCRERD
jgi:ribose 5-phosphate isomerase A